MERGGNDAEDSAASPLLSGGRRPVSIDRSSLLPITHAIGAKKKKYGKSARIPSPVHLQTGRTRLLFDNPPDLPDMVHASMGQQARSVGLRCRPEIARRAGARATHRSSSRLVEARHVTAPRHRRSTTAPLGNFAARQYSGLEGSTARRILRILAIAPPNSFRNKCYGSQRGFMVGRCWYASGIRREQRGLLSGHRAQS